MGILTQPPFDISSIDEKELAELFFNASEPYPDEVTIQSDDREFSKHKTVQDIQQFQDFCKRFDENFTDVDDPFPLEDSDDIRDISTVLEDELSDVDIITLKGILVTVSEMDYISDDVCTEFREWLTTIEHERDFVSMKTSEFANITEALFEGGEMDIFNLDGGSIDLGESMEVDGSGGETVTGNEDLDGETPTETVDDSGGDDIESDDGDDDESDGSESETSDDGGDDSESHDGDGDEQFDSDSEESEDSVDESESNESNGDDSNGDDVSSDGGEPSGEEGGDGDEVSDGSDGETEDEQSVDGEGDSNESEGDDSESSDGDDDTASNGADETEDGHEGDGDDKGGDDSNLDSEAVDGIPETHELISDAPDISPDSDIAYDIGEVSVELGSIPSANDMEKSGSVDTDLYSLVNESEWIGVLQQVGLVGVDGDDDADGEAEDVSDDESVETESEENGVGEEDENGGMEDGSELGDISDLSESERAELDEKIEEEISNADPSGFEDASKFGTGESEYDEPDGEIGSESDNGEEDDGDDGETDGEEESDSGSGGKVDSPFKM